MSKAKLNSWTRTLPYAVSMTALLMAAACAKGGGDKEKVDTKGGVTGATTEAKAQLTSAFGQSYDANDEKNLQLANRIEGASAYVKSSDQDLNGKKAVNVKVQILVADETKSNPAVIVWAEGATAQAAPKKAVPAGSAKPTDAAADNTSSGADLTLTAGASAEAQAFRVHVICLDDTCSQLGVALLEQISGADTTKTTTRKAAFIFKRGTERGGDASQDSAMELSWSAATDAKNFNSGPKVSYSAGVEARKAKGLPISDPTAKPAAPVDPAAPVIAGAQPPKAATNPAAVVTDPNAAIPVESGDGLVVDPAAGVAPVDNTNDPAAAAPAEQPAANQAPAPAPAPAAAAPAPVK